MLAHLRACLWLLVFTLILCCGIYPAILLAVGQVFFHSNAEGSLVFDESGNPIASRLISQPFNGDEYFHPRPSAVSYNGAGSGATNWGSNNYLLRDRVARAIGPIVKYQSGPKKGELVASDIEKWFQQDQYQGASGVVAQWASAHSTLATNWVKADPLNAAFVVSWQATHADDVAQWKKENPSNPDPKPEDLAGPFFASFSKEHPGKFPSAVAPEGSAGKKIEPVGEGSDIQSVFFDMWRQEHADADLEPVPADLVMASGSGLDPHITLKNAFYQLDRVAAKWAEISQQDVAAVRKEIEQLLYSKPTAPLGGLAGVRLVNVCETNLALKAKFGSKATSEK